MNDLNTLTFLRRALGVAACSLLLASAQAQVELSDIEVGNVTTDSVFVVWQTSEIATPDLQVFSDAAGSTEVSGLARIEFFPMALGDRLIDSDYAGRQARRDLQALVASRQLVLARISGLDPETEYFLRPAALDESGQPISSATLPLVEVRTATESSFVLESKQLVLNFAAEQPSLVEGAVARLESPNLPYPLFAVVGDGARASEAYFNLDQLLDAQGRTNALSSGTLGLRMRMLGVETLEGHMDYNVVYTGGFVAAAAAVVAFEPGTLLGSFAFDPVDDQLVGVPFTVTIRALDVGGSPFPDFEGPVTLASNLTLSQGGGQTASFEDGVLHLHSVAISQAGQATLTATEAGGSVSGSSNAFAVVGQTIYRQLTLSASPGAAGSVYGAGEYIDGQVAQISAMPRIRYRFDRWEGAGPDNATAASTTVAMTADRALTAIFVEKPAPAENSYDAWTYQMFADANDTSKVGPEQDYDGDGIGNLLEYAFGGDPTDPAGDEYLPQGAVDPDGYPVFTYVRRKAEGDLAYSVQYAGSLGESWTTYVPPAESVTVRPIDATLEEVSFPIPAEEEPAFVRVMVQLGK